MKIDEAEKLAKQRIQLFAAKRKDVISVNRKRFVTHSWKEAQSWCFAAAVLPKAAEMDSLSDDRPESRAVNWVVAKVDEGGAVTIEEINDLDVLLHS